MAKANLLDAVLPISEQNVWLDAPLVLDGGPIRPPPLLAGDPYDQRLELLLASPEWPEFAAFLRGYIENGLPKPLETQPSANSIGWWNITVGDKAGRVQISVNRQYAVNVDFRADVTGEPKGSGVFWIDKETAEREQARGVRLPDGFAIEQTTLKGYEREVVALTFHEVTLGDIANIFNSQWMLRAVRLINLDLMRGGRLQFGWQRFHMPKLVDALFSMDFSEDAVEQIPLAALTGNDPESVETQREIIALARIGQARFKQDVFTLYGRRCRVSGLEVAELLQACHIKPWAQASDNERVDPNNGLCLAVHMHVAFDNHLLGIAPDGRIVLSERLTREDRERLNLSEGLQMEVKAEQRPYLESRFAQFNEVQRVEGDADA